MLLRRFFLSAAIFLTVFTVFAGTIAFLPMMVEAQDQPDFDFWFTKGAMRVDLYHTGVADAEVYAVDEIIREPYWAGNPRKLIDDMNLGGHYLRVYDLETNRLIYSMGYCSLFGEWITTDEALAGDAATYHESLIFPFPKRTVQVRVERRDRINIFRTVYDFIVDPDDYHITTENRHAGFKVKKIMENGPPSSKVDLVIIGDGYKKSELHKLEDDVDRFVKILFSVEPFASRKNDFNVRLVKSISGESGVDNPREGVYRNNIAGLSFNSLELDRYMLSLSNKAVRDIAAKVPYDCMMILANEEKYGGGGIFRLYATCISDNEFDGYIFVHELGHHFAGLADEYFLSQVAYNDMYPRGVEPWEPNITALLDPESLKWGHLIAPGTPVPTPDDSTYFDHVGCFEGAGYSAEGLYRSAHDCIMKSKNLDGFCPACTASIERMIDFYSR
ncbi:MAG: IgA Peptidase M64 [Bacteroidales bacterium]|nr:IgA Peptidase M64 [Candidatus Latescibacterota bacterium]